LGVNSNDAAHTNEPKENNPEVLKPRARKKTQKGEEFQAILDRSAGRKR